MSHTSVLIILTNVKTLENSSSLDICQLIRIPIIVVLEKK